MSSSNIKVSVLISNYNYGKYLDYCIQSVLSQTYANVEIIVYDDGSTDNSLDILQQYENQVQIIARPNLGRGQCFNQINAVNSAFAASNGEIICLLDSDDAFLPQKIVSVVAEFKKNTETMLVQHRIEEIDNQNNRVSVLHNEVFQRIDHLKAVYFTGRLDYYYMPTSALSFRRKYLDHLMPILEDQYDKVVLDIRLTRPVIFYGNVRNVDLTLGQYRLHATSYTGQTMSRAYLRDLTSQTYKYFNGIAVEQGYLPLSFKPRVTQKLWTTMKYLIYVLVYEDGIQQKFKIIWNFILRSTYRRVSIKRGSQYGSRA